MKEKMAEMEKDVEQVPSQVCLRKLKVNWCWPGSITVGLQGQLVFPTWHHWNPATWFGLHQYYSWTWRLYQDRGLRLDFPDNYLGNDWTIRALRPAMESSTYLMGHKGNWGGGTYLHRVALGWSLGNVSCPGHHMASNFCWSLASTIIRSCFASWPEAVTRNPWNHEPEQTFSPSSWPDPLRVFNQKLTTAARATF